MFAFDTGNPTLIIFHDHEKITGSCELIIENSQVKSTPSYVQNISNENEICINKVTNGPREIDVSDAFPDTSW